MVNGLGEKLQEVAGMNRNLREKLCSKHCFRNFLETFIYNPQYFVTLSVPDDDEEGNLCTLIVSLMQKGRRQLRHEGVGMLSIGNFMKGCS